MRRFFGILFTLSLLLGAYASINWVFWQKHAVTDFVATPARVTEAHVTVNHGKSTTYTPHVTYHYTVAGKTYECTQIRPVDSSGSSSFANGEVDHFQALIDAGPNILDADSPNATAYVNPDNPEDAVLIREYSITPYIVSMIVLVTLGITLAVWFGVMGGSRDTMAAVALDSSGWQLLLPTISLRKRFTDSFWWFMGTSLATVPLMLHWFFVARQQGIGIFWAIVIGLILALLLLTLLRRWSLSRHISDPRVRVNPVPLKRGEPFLMEVEADALSPLRVKQMRGQVVCIEHYSERRGNKTQVGTRTKGEQSLQLVAETTIPAGEVLAGKGELLFAAGELPATTVISGKKTYPYYTWELRISAELISMVDYAGVFPLNVE